MKATPVSQVVVADGAAPSTRPSSNILSSTLVVSTLNVTAVPRTFKFSVTVKLPPIVTSSGRPTVIVPEDSETVTSLSVPLNVIVSPSAVAVLLEPSETVIELFARSSLVIWPRVIA